MQDFRGIGVGVDLFRHQPLMAEVMGGKRKKKKKKLKRLLERRETRWR